MHHEILEHLRTTNPDMLTEIVRLDQRAPTLEISDWTVARLSNKGIVNPDGLFLFSGHGRTATEQTERAWSVVVILPLLVRSRMWRDHRFRSALYHQLDELLPSVPSISDHSLEAQPCQQGWRMRTVMTLPCCQEQTQRVARPVHQDMHFVLKPPRLRPSAC